MFWGSLSDRIGRKPVLLMGNTGTMIALIILGLAPNFWVGLAGRVFGGLLNGNVAVIQVSAYLTAIHGKFCANIRQTMVGELVSNPKHERK